jgi:hypothetical protein
MWTNTYRDLRRKSLESIPTLSHVAVGYCVLGSARNLEQTSDVRPVTRLDMKSRFSVSDIFCFSFILACAASTVDILRIVIEKSHGSAFMKPMRKLFYNITITSVSVLVAVVVGGLETLALVQGEYNFFRLVLEPGCRNQRRHGFRYSRICDHRHLHRHLDCVGRRL